MADNDKIIGMTRAELTEVVRQILAEIPTKLPADGGDADTVNGHTVNADVPENAKFTDTTYSAMVGATASAAGKVGLVPAPAANTQDRFLSGSGTWIGAEKWIGRSTDSTFMNNTTVSYPYVCTVAADIAKTMGLSEYWWHMEYFPHSANNDGYGMQIAYPLNASALNPRYRIASGKTWGNWNVLYGGRSIGRIPTFNASGTLWDGNAENANDLYAQWDATNQYFKLKTYGGNNVAVDIATSGSSSQHQVGTTPTLANGVKTNISVSFNPRVVLLLISGHVIDGGYAITMGTKSFTITPASISQMGTTQPQYIAFS